MREYFGRLNRPDDGDEPVDLSKVASDDVFIESLSAAPLFDDVDQPVRDDVRGQQFRVPSAETPPTVEVQLAALLRSWQREIGATPLPPRLSDEVAVAMVRNAPLRRRSLRPMLAVAAAIGGLLIGSAAIGARSAPVDSVLFPLTQLLWGDRADSLEAADKVRDQLDAANQDLDAGHPEEAQAKLDVVTVVITKVSPRDGRENLESEVQSVAEEISVARTSSPSSTTSTHGNTVTVVPSPTLSTSEPTPPASTVDGSPTTDAPSPSVTTTDPGTSEPSVSTTPTPSESTQPSDPSTTGEPSPTATPSATPSSSTAGSETPSATESNTVTTTATTVSGAADGPGQGRGRGRN
jgi:hypothetical protein